jgi:hypothetical protein
MGYRPAHETRGGVASRRFVRGPGWLLPHHLGNPDSRKLDLGDHRQLEHRLELKLGLRFRDLWNHRWDQWR